MEADMHRFSRYLGAVILVSAIGNAARGSAQDAPPVPDDRAGDSFRIYSSLIPLGETASPGWPHDLWLIRDETLEMAKAKQPCNAAEGSALNPHSAVHPSQNQRADFDEILRDFDQHCHERFTLRGGNWSFKQRYRLLTQAEQDNFMASRSHKQNPDAPNPFAGAPALYGFSPVYFNAHHTVALVYATHWCGGLCGQGMWIALALVDGEWKTLNWRSDSWIS